MVAGFDAAPQAFIDRLKAVLETILTTDQLVATFVGSKVDFDHFKQVSEDFFKHLGTHKIEKQAFTNPVEVLNEGFKTAQEINYVAKGYNQTLLGVPVNGMNLFLKICSRTRLLMEYGSCSRWGIRRYECDYR